MENFNNKVNEAAAKFLTHRGYDIIEETWKRDGGMLPVDMGAASRGQVRQGLHRWASSLFQRPCLRRC